jgi:hypothetical protein
MASLATEFRVHADLPPLRVDEGGAVRVGNTRVSLDLLVQQYENGMTPEDMVRALTRCSSPTSTRPSPTTFGTATKSKPT